MKQRFLLLITLTLIFSGCAINYEAMPSKTATPSEELEFMYKTDQKERRRVLGKIFTKNHDDLMKDPKIIAVCERDSARLARVIQLDQQKLILSDEDKLYAASMYDHEGGPKMKADTTYFRVAYQLFKELYDKDYKRGMTKSLMNTSYDRWQYSLNHK